MNRYESAYRDYTIQRGDESSLYHQPPQRPERSNNNKGVRLVGTAGGGNRSTAAAAAAAIVESSESSIESTSYDQSRMMIPQQQQQQQVQINQGFSTDEESFILQRYHPHHHHQQQQHQQHHHHHHQISSRELSDRSGGERSNPDFLVANDAIQSYPARSPSLDDSTSMSDSDQQQHQQMRHHHHLLADGPSYYMMNDGGTGNVMIGNGGGGGGVGDGGSSSYVDHHDVVPEVYIPQPELLTRMPTSELSHGSYRTYRTVPPYSEDATLRSKKSKRGGIVIETSRAPHPMCPNTRSCCCLMLLFNLGLLLICLGFVIVLQLNDPPFVWYLGVFMLVFGFVSLIIGLIFCAWMCREGSPDAPLPPNSELYWTHHWRKTIYMPESHGRVHETPVKVPMGEEIHYMDETSDSYRSQPRYHNNNDSSNLGSNNSARY